MTKILAIPGEGERLDRFELVAELAQGGMATVYLARFVGVAGFKRFVAIKRLHPHLAKEQSISSRCSLRRVCAPRVALAPPERGSDPRNRNAGRAVLPRHGIHRGRHRRALDGARRERESKNSRARRRSRDARHEHVFARGARALRRRRHRARDRAPRCVAAKYFGRRRRRRAHHGFRSRQSPSATRERNARRSAQRKARVHVARASARQT